MYQKVPEKTFGIADYCPVQEAFSWIRMVELIVPWSSEQIKMLLDQHPTAVIYKVISHEPIFTEGMSALSTMNMESRGLVAARQRIPDYIDDFGQYVYVCGRIGWTPSLDVDERYEGISTAPQEILERNDLCNRTGASERVI